MYLRVKSCKEEDTWSSLRASLSWDGGLRMEAAAVDGFLEAFPVDDPSWVMVVDGIVLLILLETETFRAPDRQALKWSPKGGKALEQTQFTDFGLSMPRWPLYATPQFVCLDEVLINNNWPDGVEHISCPDLLPECCLIMIRFVGEEEYAPEYRGKVWEFAYLEQQVKLDDEWLA